MQPVLRTPRLVLRPFEIGDAKPLHAILSDHGAMQYWDTPHATMADTQAFVAGTINAPRTETCDFVVTLNGQVIGKMGMWAKPEVGFFIAPAHQRRGYAREALAAVTAHLFDAYPDIAALTADVDPRNEASLALLAASGFSETHRAARTIRINGEWCDSVYLSMPRPH